MRVTLVVASYNGQETLSQSLQSLEAILIPQSIQFNVIYIDNASTDSTSTILSSFKPPFPFCLLYQKKKGKNAALNIIFDHHESLGEYIIFSDDDVVFSSTLLLEYEKVFKRYPSLSIFGGSVRPFWLAPPPKQVIEGVDSVVAFAITPEEKGYASGIISPEKLHGPNMVIKKGVFEKGIRFNESIGPNGENYMMGSETELLLRLKTQGYQAAFSIEASVKHIIHPYQFTNEWIKARAFKAGRSMLMHQIKNAKFKRVPELLGYPRWALIMSLKKRLLAAVTYRSSSKYYNYLWTSHHLKGYCMQYKVYIRK